MCRPICTHSNGVCPAPSAQGDNRLLGVAFGKHSPDNYYANCDTFYNNFDNPLECHWHDCQLLPSISARASSVQMTVVIYM